MDSISVYIGASPREGERKKDERKHVQTMPLTSYQPKLPKTHNEASRPQLTFYKHRYFPAKYGCVICISSLSWRSGVLPVCKERKKICNGPFMYRCSLHQFVSGGVLERPLQLKKKTCGGYYISIQRLSFVRNRELFYGFCEQNRCFTWSG